MSSTVRMKEARRPWGSEWLKDHPAWMEWLYDLTKTLLAWLYPAMRRINPRFAERFLIGNEVVFKGYLFNCQMCGQCILHSTGMTCPMNCPKNLRNGPCGGVRPDGHCEVIPERMCVWVQAYARSQAMPKFGHELAWIQPPVDRTLQGSSAWVNLFEGRDAQLPAGWVAVGEKEQPKQA
jgi:hypothetical protein